jgi:hypothetical protein
VGTAGVAYGSVASQGWTKDYSATNKAVYKQSSGSNQFFLRVDDTNAQNAQLRGYESISDVDGSTSSGLFPTIAQVALGSGLYLYKSTAASGTARAWFAIGNGKLFMLFVNAGADTNNYFQAFVFGDIKSLKSGDAHATILLASSASSNTSVAFAGVMTNAAQPGPATAASAGTYIARTYAETGSAIGLVKVMDGICCSQGLTTGQMQYPNGADGGIYLSPMHLMEPTSGSTPMPYRGTVPGLWFLGHRRDHMGAAQGDTITGTGTYSGRTWEIMAFNSTTGLAVETSNTWDT